MSQNTAQWFLHKLSHVTGGSDELPVFTPTTSGMVPPAGGDRNLFLRADGTWANPRTSGSSGARGTLPGGQELPTFHAFTHITGGTDLIPSFTSTTSGIVPLSGGGTVNFLRADGTWAAPPGGTGSTTFVGLTDTPSSYTGAAGYMVLVNSTPNALIFQNPSTYNLTNFNDNLTGNKYVDHSTVSIIANTGVGSIVGGGDLTVSRTLTLSGDVVSPGNTYYYGTNGAGTKGWYVLSGLSTFIGLSDTPANYTGSANFLLRVNTLANAVEFINRNTLTLSGFNDDLSYVSPSGTPVVNQVGYWISATAMTGETGLTWSGTVLDTDGTIQTDTIVEHSTGSGVTVEGNELKDSQIGVGASIGAEPLYVYHATADVLALFESGDANAGIAFKDSTTVTSPQIRASGDNLQIDTNSLTRFSVLSDGTIYMYYLGSDDTEDHVIAIDDSTGLLSKRSVSSISGPTYTFDSGLTEVGGNVDWGGALTSSVSITGASESYSILLGTSGDRLSDFSIYTGDNIIINSSSGYLQLVAAGSIYADSPIRMANGNAIRTTTTTANTFNLAGHNGTGYTNLLTVTSDSGGNPTIDLGVTVNTYMAGLGSDDAEDHVVAIDDTTGLLTKRAVSTIGGSSTFIGLSDTPTDWTGGVAGYMLMVNSTPDAVEFIDPSGYAVNNFSGTLTAGWTITGSNTNIWRAESVHSATGSVYAEFADLGKSFSAVSWSADNYTGSYGSLYVDDASVNITIDDSVNVSRIEITQSAMTITDTINSTGFRYAADYSTAGKALGARWIPDWNAVITQIAGKDINTAAGGPGNPGAGQDGYILYWDNGNTRYDLKAESGGTHALLSTTHTDTATSAVTRGAIITGQTATPQWDTLAISLTSTHLLRTDGTDISWGAFNFADLGTTPTTLSGYGISDTKANFNTALSDGSFMFVGDAPTSHASSHISTGSDSMATFSTTSTTTGLVTGSNNLGATYYLDGSGVWSIPPTGSSVSFGNTDQVPHMNAGTPGTDFDYSADFTFTTTTGLYVGTQIGVGTAASSTYGIQSVHATSPARFIRNLTTATAGVPYTAHTIKLVTTSSDIDTGPFMYFQYEDSSAVQTNLGAIGAMRDGADNTGTLKLYSYSGGTRYLRTKMGGGAANTSLWVNAITTAGDAYVAFQQNESNVGIVGWDDSAAAFKIDIGTDSDFTATPGLSITDDGTTMMIDSSPASDTASGVIALVDVDVNGYGIGAALHLDTDGNYILADANGSTTMPCSALAMETGTGTGKKVLLVGYLTDLTYNFTVGAVVYVSTTGGNLTTTAPSGTGDFVQAVGIAMTADTLYFNPDFAMVEIV